ncbi:MAG: alpha-galactosidase [Spirochaetes bacterium]|nr:alpha-galactosidase [Spirochaetota bacterium]
MYLNFKKYTVSYDEKAHSFSCAFTPHGMTEELLFIKEAKASILSYQGELFSTADYKKIECRSKADLNGRTLSVMYSEGPAAVPRFELHFTLDAATLQIRTFTRAIVRIEGAILWGEHPETSTFGVRLNAESHDLRAACGPAFSMHDNALFDRSSDRALEFNATELFHVSFDWASSRYRFTFESGLDFGRSFSFRIHEDYCKNKFTIPYAPIDKRHGFATPPVGWMTWYAVQFKASEDLVLKNAHALASIFGSYSEKLCLWVDWEWNHNGFTGLGEEGVDTFTPRKAAYPNGLAHVAEEIEKLGLVPALWIGATNDGQQNELLRKNPAWILGQKPEWCGQWWIDPSHPDVVDKYIPAVFRQILNWGYKAIKWDCLPASLNVGDALHSKFHNPALSTDTAMRNIVISARKTIGPDVYMLSCSGETERDVTFAMDQFSAARIGGDIFGWGDFLSHSIDRVFHFYPVHNVACYADGDNIVLRDEFNTPAQARSRVSFYGLAGLPVTMGDEFTALDDTRIDMLKRIIPVADIHPMDLMQKKRAASYVTVNLSVCREFGNWNVVSIMNTKDEPLALNLSLSSDFHIDTRNGKRYAVYDFWNQKFMGIVGDTMQLTIAPMDSAVLRITPLASYPQVISTSRHITQGGYDLNELRWDASANTLSGNSKCVSGETYRITLHVPEQFTLTGIECSEASDFRSEDGVTIVTITSGAGDIPWKLNFKAA